MKEHSRNHVKNIKVSRLYNPSDSCNDTSTYRNSQMRTLLMLKHTLTLTAGVNSYKSKWIKKNNKSKNKLLIAP